VYYKAIGYHVYVFIMMMTIIIAAVVSAWISGTSDAAGKSRSLLITKARFPA